MTPKEIKTWARIVALSQRLAGKRVRITFEGKYLAFDNGAAFFTEEKARAHQFDYTREDVGGQLRQVEQENGVIWSAEEVERELNPEDTCSGCDGQGTVPATTEWGSESEADCPLCESEETKLLAYIRAKDLNGFATLTGEETVEELREAVALLKADSQPEGRTIEEVEKLLKVGLPCQHLTGYWINKAQRNFRCYECQCQFHIGDDLPANHPTKGIEVWRAS